MNNRIFHDMDTQKASSCHQKYHCITTCFVHKGQWDLRGLQVLPASDPTYFGRMRGKKKSSSIKELGSTVAGLCTSSADTAAVSAYKNSRRVWYYIGCRKTHSNRNCCGSDIFSTTSYYMAMVLSVFVWCIKRQMKGLCYDHQQ